MAAQKAAEHLLVNALGLGRAVQIEAVLAHARHAEVVEHAADRDHQRVVAEAPSRHQLGAARVADRLEQDFAPAAIEARSSAKLESEMMVAGVREVVEAVRLDAQGARRDLVQQGLPDVDQRAVDQRDQALPRRPNRSPSLVASTRPPAPPPTTTMWCGAATAASARTAAARQAPARAPTPPRPAHVQRSQQLGPSALLPVPRAQPCGFRRGQTQQRPRPPSAQGPWFGQRQDGATIVVSSTLPVRRGRLPKCTRDLPNHKRLCCNAAMRKCRISITQAYPRPCELGHIYHLYNPLEFTIGQVFTTKSCVTSLLHCKKHITTAVPTHSEDDRGCARHRSLSRDGAVRIHPPSCKTTQ